MNNTFWLTFGLTVLAEILIIPLSLLLAKFIDTSEEETVDSFIAKDRLRYTKNSKAALFAYFAILFNVFYFVSIYNTDAGNYYYTYTIGLSVIVNLLFLLAAFLSSEGVKNYKLGYAIAFIFMGAFQIFRIFGIPTDAHKTLIDETSGMVMGDKQFTWVCIWLVLSSICCFASATLGIYKTKMLRDHEKELAAK